MKIVKAIDFAEFLAIRRRLQPFHKAGETSKIAESILQSAADKIRAAFPGVERLESGNDEDGLFVRLEDTTARCGIEIRLTVDTEN